MGLHVPAQLVLAVEVALAARDGASKAALDFVGALVLGQVGGFAEALATDGAF